MTNNDYPSDATLQKIRDWDIADCKGVLDFIREQWKYMGRNTRPGIYTFATGGWSGNELLLEALYASPPWHMLQLNSIRLPGGLLCCAITDEAREEMQEMHSTIVTWAWSKAPPKSDS